MPRRLIFWLLATVCLAGCGGSDDGDTALPAATTQQVDATIDAALRTQNLPSAAVGIWIPGRGNYVTARGLADRATGLPRTPDQPFRIASITKTFIGTAVLQLVDDGKLKLGDPVSRWYPDFPRASRITVDDLLRMRSGIPDSADTAFLAEYYANPLIVLSADDMIARAAARSTEFTDANVATVYDNINFILLERIVEKTSGTDIRSFLAERIFRPLGMTNTSYPGGPALPGPLRGYSLDAASQSLTDRTLLNPVPAGGAGAIVSTLDDLHRYARAICTGTLLAPATQALRVQYTDFSGTTQAGYGRGLVRLGPLCGHNGTIFGFSSEMWYLPAHDAVVVVDVNRLDLDDHSQSGDLFAQIVRILFPDVFGS